MSHTASLSSQSVTVGFDIGGTNLKAACVDSRGEIIDFVEVPSLATVDPSAVRKSLRDLFTNFQQKGFQPKGIGIGCAGSIDPELGVVRNSPNFRGWNHVPLKEWMEKDCRLPTTVHNDANCAAVTEHRIGAGRGTKNMLLVTLGTGIGGGMILNGTLYVGRSGTAGEIGHFPIDPHGPPCGCGMKGCFERICSSTAVERQTGFPSIEVFSPARSAEFKTFLDSYYESFSTGLAGFANTLDPERILLGGAMSAGLRGSIERIRGAVRKKVFPAIAETMQIDFAEHGNQSGCIGAALLAHV